jgi:hypothetical protein
LVSSFCARRSSCVGLRFKLNTLYIRFLAGPSKTESEGYHKK